MAHPHNGPPPNAVGLEKLHSYDGRQNVSKRQHRCVVPSLFITSVRIVRARDRVKENKLLRQELDQARLEEAALRSRILELEQATAQLRTQVTDLLTPPVKGMVEVAMMTEGKFPWQTVFI